MHLRVGLLTLVVLLTACGSGQTGLSDLDLDFDFDGALDQVRDCDALAGRLVSAVVSAAEKVDEVAAGREGPLPDAELAEVVSRISLSRYFSLAEQIGCNSLELRLQAVEQLRDVPGGSEVAEAVIGEVIDQIRSTQAGS